MSPRAIYTCQHCARTFKKGEHLTRHERTHTAERPFTCSVCGTSHARRDTLQRHMRVHERHGQFEQRMISTDTPSVSEDVPASQDGTVPEALVTIVDQHTQSSPSGGNHLLSEDTLPDITLDDSPWSFPDLSVFDLPGGFDFAAFDLALGLAPTTAADDLADSILLSDTQCEQRASRLGTPLHARAARQDITHNVRPRAWFSQVDSPRHAVMSLAMDSAADSTQSVDDKYRRSLQSQLNSQPSKVILPSTPFLNRCIRLYMTSFTPLLPILHLPTFRPAERNALLLLAICAVGSQLVGTMQARSHGERMFESLHRTVLASWTSMLREDTDLTSVLLAVVLGQTFAILSANPANLLTARAFHGTMLLCYERFLGLDVQLSTQHSKARQLQEEAKVRMGCALRIQDTELALLFHQAPLWQLRTRPSTPLASDKGYVTHSDTDTDTGVQTSWLSEHAKLADILSGIAEKRASSWADEDFQSMEDALMSWLDRHTMHTRYAATCHRLFTLWHSAFIAVTVDADDLEILCGRGGIQASAKPVDKLQHWVSSDQSTRALVHAYCIWRRLAETKITNVSGLHEPRCAYLAGLTFCVLAKLLDRDIQFEETSLLRFQDIRTMTDQGYLTPSDWRTMGSAFCGQRALADKTYEVVGFLRRLGPWGLCQNLAATLEGIIESDSMYA